MGALLLIGTALVVLALITAGAVLCIRGSWARARATGIVAAAVLAVYSLALVGVGIASPARSLALNEWKCFDDWCATVTSVTRTGDDVVVSISTRNQGRREQAPDTPRVWLVHNSRRDEVSVPELASRVPGGTLRQLREVRLSVPSSEGPVLVITEGGFPSRGVIGDDNSPFYRQPAWLLS
jgi:hypothetical protein